MIRVNKCRYLSLFIINGYAFFIRATYYASNYALEPFTFTYFEIDKNISLYDELLRRISSII